MGNVKLNEKPTAEDFAYAYAEDSAGATVRVPKEKIHTLETDDTLTQSGIPADAKAVGNKFGKLSQEIVNQQTALETEVTNRENAIADLKAQESQKSPAFPDTNNTVENALAWLKENGDTSKVYLLPDGYIYAYMYTEHQKAAYTNRVSSSIDTDGSIYNDVGYKEGYRLNSSAVETASDTGIISGFIPYNGESIQVRVKKHSASGYTNANNYVWGYDSSFIKADLSTQPNFYGLVTYLGATYETDANDRIVLTFSDTTLEAFKDCKYIRVSGYYEAVSDLAVALGEEISDSVTTVKEYAWTNTGHAFVPTDYEDRINELEEKTEDHETRLEILETGIPSYWLEELETKADSIQQAMESAGRNKSAFLWYTDAHWDAGNSGNSPLLLNYLHKNTSMNKVFFGGDIIGDPTELTHDTVKHLYDEWRSNLKDLVHHSAIGNHDNIHKGRSDSEVSDIVYSFLLAPEETPDMVMGDDFYYYIDNPCEKTRYLILDSGRYSLSDDETKFIIETLTSVPSDWHIVVISHIWFQYTSATAPTVGSINAYMQKALDLFDAYNARESGSVTMVSTTYSYDFTDAGGKVEFCMGGHIHIDLVLFSIGGIPVILTASDVNQDRSSDEDEDSGTLGTTTESAVFGIVADYDNNKISVIGVGRGGSREITI